jgi:trypsin
MAGDGANREGMRTRYVTPLIAALGLLALPAGLPAKAIVNGSAAEEGQFPFMAAIQEDDFAFCGGTVIAPNWVITAAHCAYKPSDNPVGAGEVYKPGELEVVTGRTDLQDTSVGQELVVDQVVIHPDYASNENYDIALLHLAEPTTSPAIQLAGPDDDDLEVADTPVITAGWGDRLPTQGLFAPYDMYYTTLRVVEDQPCDQKNLTYTVDGPTSVCAQEFLTDSCQGDSGGPLFATKNGVNVQVGIVSYGLSCATPDFPGVYTEVNNPSIAEFISTTTATPPTPVEPTQG